MFNRGKRGVAVFWKTLIVIVLILFAFAAVGLIVKNIVGIFTK